MNPQLSRKENECERCGMCCLHVPNWYKLTDMERALIRSWDREAEEILKKVDINGCPNLSFIKNKATCKIYKNRFNFCKALKYGSKECQFARDII